MIAHQREASGGKGALILCACAFAPEGSRGGASTAVVT